MTTMDGVVITKKTLTASVNLNNYKGKTLIFTATTDGGGKTSKKFTVEDSGGGLDHFYAPLEGCNNACTADCGGNCANTCRGGCGSTCKGNCLGSCKDSCGGPCDYSCTTSCKGFCNGCTDLCTGCTGTCSGTASAYCSGCGGNCTKKSYV